MSVRPSIRRGGFTLLEMLAVIVIVSLVAGVAVVGLASSADDARLRTAAARWQDLDAKARILVRTHGPLVMSLDTAQRTVRLHPRGSAEPIGTLELPSGVLGELRAGDTPRPLVIDRLGSSLDYQASVSMDERARRWRVTGYTGLIEED